MISNTSYEPTQTSGEMQTAQASIVMTAEMFKMLSSDIYTDKILAVVREPICNGRDSHTMSKEDRPLTVHLPNKLEPHFSVRDYGTGLSVNDIMHVYLVYGASTKTRTNSLIGGKGIGSKSPLAYTDSFIVESYFEGVKSTYSIYKDEGIPNVSKLGESHTTEPSGLLVKVAIAEVDFNKFANSLAGFLRYFDSPVDVVGREINTKVKVNIDTPMYTLYSVQGYEDRGEIKAMMGGVVYSISKKLTESLAKIVNQDLMILKFGIGDLEIAPSREALSENKDTLAKIEEMVKDVMLKFYDNVQVELDSGITPDEAFKLLKKYDITYSAGWRDDNELKTKKIAEHLTYDGDPLEVLYLMSTLKIRAIHTDSYYRKHLDNTLKVRELGNKDVIFLVLDKTMGSIKTAAKMAQRAGSGTRICLLAEEDKTELEAWFGPVKYEYNSVKYVELFPKAERDAAKIAVARSGLYTLTMREVRELDPNSEGYYLGFNRDISTMSGMPIGLSEEMQMRELIGLVSDMQMEIADIFEGKDLYIARKGGLPAVNKTKIVELTWKTLLTKISKVANKKARKAFINWEAKADSLLNKDLKGAWDTIKSSYPLHAAQDVPAINATKGINFVRSLPRKIVMLLIPDLNDNVTELGITFTRERKQFKKDFPILQSMRMWDLKPDVVEDITDLFKIRMKKNRKALTAAKEEAKLSPDLTTPS